MNEELVLPESPLNLKEAGESEVLPRSFENSPPLIPHVIVDFLPIKIGENMCFGCHDPEAAADVGATPVPKSHMYDIRNDKQIEGLAGSNFNCTQCHVVQADAPTIVGNSFKADFRNDKSRISSNLLETLNEGVE